MTSGGSPASGGAVLTATLHERARPQQPDVVGGRAIGRQRDGLRVGLLCRPKLLAALLLFSLCDDVPVARAGEQRAEPGSSRIDVPRQQKSAVADPAHQGDVRMALRPNRPSRRRHRGPPAGLFELHAFQARQQFVATLLEMPAIRFGLPGARQLRAVGNHPHAEREEEQAGNDQRQQEQEGVTARCAEHDGLSAPPF